MASFRFIMDATADLSAALAERYGASVIPMEVQLGGETLTWSSAAPAIDPSEFYRRMREGEEASTSLVNELAYRAAFEPILQAGEDVLYLGFSAALSGCLQTAWLTAAALEQEYPGRRVAVVDTQNASLAEVLLLAGAFAEREAGYSLSEVVAWIERERVNVSCWCTVDDLAYLRRGGRLSAAGAVVGTALKIKPIIHVDEEGRLVPTDKIRGRKHSIKALVEQMERTCIPERTDWIGIAHGDCLEEAQYLQKLIEKRFPGKEFVVAPVGPVIGAHTGPGTLAVFFIGRTK